MSAYQVPLLPLPPTFLAAVDRYEAELRRAVVEAEKAIVDRPDFDAQRASGVWPNDVWNSIYSPARSAFFNKACDHGYGKHECREDLMEIASDLLMRSLSSESERWRAWFDEAWRLRQQQRIGGLFGRNND